MDSACLAHLSERVASELVDLAAVRLDLAANQQGVDLKSDANPGCPQIITRALSVVSVTGRLLTAMSGLTILRRSLRVFLKEMRK